MTAPTAPAFKRAEIRNTSPSAMDNEAKIYVDPERAVVRELVSNAIDAQRENGNAEPIDVNLDSHANMLTINDHGIGMTAAQIEENFVNYGASTKTGDVLAIGQFGKGAKSIYAVADGATITSTRDGVTAVVELGRDEQGFQGSRVLSSSFTGATSGTEIAIPLSNDARKHSLIKAIERLAYYLPRGSLIFRSGHNVAELAHLDDNTLDELSDATVTVEINSGDAVVLLNGIAYDLDYWFNIHRQLVIHAQPGTIALTPSRETIQQTEANREVIKTLVDQWRETTIKPHRSEYDAASTLYAQKTIADAYPTTHLSLLGIFDMQQRLSYNLVPDGYRWYNGFDFKYETYTPGNSRTSHVITHERVRDALVLDTADLTETGYRSLLSRLPAAIKQARRHQPELTVMLMDKEHVALELARCDKMVPPFAINELTWGNPADFLAAHRPETATRAKARTLRVLSAREALDRFISNNTYKEAPIRTTAEIKTTLDNTGGPLVLCEHSAYGYRWVDNSPFTTTLRSALGQATFAFAPQRGIIKVRAEYPDYEVISLQDYIKQEIDSRVAALSQNTCDAVATLMARPELSTVVHRYDTHLTVILAALPEEHREPLARDLDRLTNLPQGQLGAAIAAKGTPFEVSLDRYPNLTELLSVISQGHPRHINDALITTMIKGELA